MTVATGMALANEHDRAVGRTAPRVAQVETLQSLEAAEPVWRGLQRDGVTSPYQHFEFLAAWQRHVGPHEGTEPCIVVGRDAAARPLFLWPLGLRRGGPANVAEFLGGKHSNFNFGLWRPDVAHAFSVDDLRRALRALGERRPDIDMLRLLRQPHSWEGVPNPFALLPHQEAVDDCPRLTLEGSGEDVLKALLSSAMRGRLRTKERKLQKLPGYRYFCASTPEEVDRLLDAFFPAKAVHMTQQGLRDIFAEPGVQAFLREACRTALDTTPPLIEIHALDANGEMLAFFGAITDGRRFSLMFNTYTLGENAKHSPGLILLTHVVANCADRGMRVFDLGVGEAGYKTFFCREPEPLFDSFLPLTARGRIAAAAQRPAFAAMRQIKRTPALYDAVQTLRRRLRGS